MKGAAYSRVTLVPVGRCDEDVSRYLVAEIVRILSLPCRMGEYLPRPLDAFDHQRTQYEAGKMIERVEREPREAGEAVLALTEGDLFVEPYNYTFGHTGLKSGVGVLSLFRLRPEFWGEEPDGERFALRATVEALYQLGRILGLSSCDDPECPMCSVNGIDDVDRKRARFCPECQEALGL